MDSRASYFIEQIFKAFKKHPKQMPESTYSEYINNAKQTVVNEIAKTDATIYKSELEVLLRNDLKNCKLSSRLPTKLEGIHRN